MNYNLTKLKNQKYFVILIFLTIIFLFAYSWLYHGFVPKFSWPDETGNYFFIRLFAEKSQLQFYEPLNQSLHGLIRPRSVGFSNGFLVPGSFLGMVLMYGCIAKIFGSWIILYLTPIFSVLNVLFFYLLLCRIFDKRVAFISSIFLFILPVYWYYSYHGMLHNIFFIFLLTSSLFFLTYAFLQSKRLARFIFIFASGILAGFALITRTSEIFWVLFIFIALFVIYRKKIPPVVPISIAICIFCSFIPVFYYNKVLNGSIFTFPYVSFSDLDFSPASISTGGAFFSLFDKLRYIFFPFGINFRIIGLNFYNYIVSIFPYFFVLLFFSLTFVTKNIVTPFINSLFHLQLPYRPISFGQKIYISLYLLVSLWLILYYGSFVISEHSINVQNGTILGTSYLRYWLPIYIFGIPICSQFIISMRMYFQKQRFGTMLFSVVACMYVFLSVYQLVLDPVQGLKQSRVYTEGFIHKSRVIESITEHNSVIIAGSNDKVLFPERRVIVGIQEKSVPLDELRRFIQGGPVYFLYNPLDNYALSTRDFFIQHNIGMRAVSAFSSKNEILYKIEYQ